MRNTPLNRRIHLLTGLIFLIGAYSQGLSANAGVDLRPGDRMAALLPAPQTGIVAGGHAKRVRTAPIYIPIDVPLDIVASAGQVSGGAPLTITVQMSNVVAANTTVQIITDQEAAFSNLPSSVVVPAGSQYVTIPVTTNGSSSVANVGLAAYNSNGGVYTNVVVTP